VFAKLPQREDGLFVRRGAQLQTLLATEARRLKRPQASFGLPPAQSIDFDLTTAGITAIHPLLCSENTGARVSVARFADLLGLLLW